MIFLAVSLVQLHLTRSIRLLRPSLQPHHRSPDCRLYFPIYQPTTTTIMGKAGRFACIFLPMAATIMSLVSLIIVGMGGTNKNSSALNNLYFFRANTSDIAVNGSLTDNLPHNDFTDAILGKVSNDVAQEALNIKDLYHVSLWNYCSGDFQKNSSGGMNDHITYCSPRQKQYWFNPVDVWHLNNSVTDRYFSKELRDGLNVYHSVAKWMYIAYIIAVVTTAAEILVGFTALFSRLGSLATTIVSSISSIFTIAFALTSTILYATLTGVFNNALKQYHIHGSMGRTIYVWVWLSVLFSWIAGIFWLFSSCCCSGRSDRIKGYSDGRRGRWGGKKEAPYTYERMPSPQPGFHPAHGAQGGVPMDNMQPGRHTAYEPYRQTV